MDGGAYRPKRCVGDLVVVGVDVFGDGHDTLRAVARWKGPGDPTWSEAPLRPVDAEQAGVRWQGAFVVERPGRWTWSVLAWADHLATWLVELRRKVDAGQADLSGELSEGALLLEGLRRRARGSDRELVAGVAEHLANGVSAPSDELLEELLAPALSEVGERWPDRKPAAGSAIQGLDVDPVLARFGAWYELFPRSWGGFPGVTEQLPALADLGFDVVYLPPIHPIGHTNRKGANNALVAAPGDPGSPWAIGDETGGHTAVHPDLGTIRQFDAMVGAARQVGIEIALDFAIQCSADHPWLTEHPEWFNRRPDGTLKYAENPPKKYQDIYNVNFDCDDWQGLWQALLDVVVHWVDRGIRVFRVDNPHTKPVPFWEWLIASVREEHPDVIFLAEAFTKRAMMQALGKVGFNQSYTYFTWKSSRWELTEYVQELAGGEEREYFRPNFFTNTPDILTEELVRGGPPAFASRLVLAATLSPSYGIYSGYESYENVPVRPGSEEYLDSEKFQVEERSLDGPLLPLVRRLNHIRRDNPALQQFERITFLDTENDALIAYAKRGPEQLVDGQIVPSSNVVLTVVSLDPERDQEGITVVSADLGLPPTFAVSDLLTGDRFDWHTGRNYVRLSPGLQPAHVLRVETSR